MVKLCLSIEACLLSLCFFLSCKIYKRQEEYPVCKHLFSALFYKLYSSSLQAMPPHPALTVRGPRK